MTDKEEKDAARKFAETLISDDYKAVVIIVLDNEDNVDMFFTGGGISAIGMLRYGEAHVIKTMIDE